MLAEKPASRREINQAAEQKQRTLLSERRRRITPVTDVEVQVRVRDRRRDVNAKLPREREKFHASSFRSRVIQRLWMMVGGGMEES